MIDFSLRLATLRRPALLLQTARTGLRFYKKERDLARILRQDAGGKDVLPQLLEAEQHLEHKRQAGDAAYSIQAHIEILIALLAEYRAVFCK